MPSKTYNLDNIGEVSIYKRRGTKRINLRVFGAKVRVTQPFWVPYSTGLQFVSKNREWITQQLKTKPGLTLLNGMVIGKTRRLEICTADRLKTRLENEILTIYIPPHLNVNSPKVLELAKQAIKRSLKDEAEKTLIPRLLAMADNYGFQYKSVHCKSMRSKWGSCTSNKEIVLNIYLMMVPWELIDYVLLHELAHTKHLNHSSNFWGCVGEIMPDYKLRRKNLKLAQNTLSPFH